MKQNSATRLVQLFEKLNCTNYLDASAILLPEETTYKRVQFLKFFIADIFAIQAYLQEKGFQDETYDQLITDLSERIVIPESVFKQTDDITKRLKWVRLGMPEEYDCQPELTKIANLIKEYLGTDSPIIQKMLNTIQESIEYYQHFGLQIVADSLHSVYLQCQMNQSEIEQNFEKNPKFKEKFKTLFGSLHQLYITACNHVTPYSPAVNALNKIIDQTPLLK